MNINRKIVLDTETTGMNKKGVFYKNHRIIEIGAVEIVDRKLTGNNFHVYINPNRLIENEAFNIHGISNSFLIDKPIFSNIFSNFIKYIRDSELIIHNAKFDVSFLNYEIRKLKTDIKNISQFCSIVDTLKIARSLFPGKRNNLDILCKRYNINISRKLHSALLDAKILAKIYLRMTSKQKSFFFNSKLKENIFKNCYFKEKLVHFNSIKVVKATDIENNAHIKYINNMKKLNFCLWKI